jgi:N-methylhydantoinase B/oxoprolinase/acetone carboxylase alpha subunit
VDTLPIQSVEIITKKPCWLKSRATAGFAAQHVELMAKNQDLRFEAGRFRHSRLPQHVPVSPAKWVLRRFVATLLSRQVKRAPFYNCSKALQCARTQKSGITLVLLQGSAPRNGRAARTANAIATSEAAARIRFARLPSGAGLRHMWRSR